AVFAAPLLYTLSLHDALPISPSQPFRGDNSYFFGSSDDVLTDVLLSVFAFTPASTLFLEALALVSVAVEPEWFTLTERSPCCARSEEHTSELQSLRHLVCRLL